MFLKVVQNSYGAIFAQLSTNPEWILKASTINGWVWDKWIVLLI